MDNQDKNDPEKGWLRESMARTESALNAFMIEVRSGFQRNDDNATRDAKEVQKQIADGNIATARLNERIGLFAGIFSAIGILLTAVGGILVWWLSSHGKP